VARGEVDAGIVYATDIAVMAGNIKVVSTAPEGSHKAVVYPIALVKGTKSGGNARAFIKLATSREGKIILEKYGFKAVT
jgi:molybdate transport system substrate-binding protein